MTLIKETDYGTPEVTSDKMVTLEIDGQQVTVPEGTSIMRAAMELGTKIPKLCATDMLDAFGSCHARLAHAARNHCRVRCHTSACSQDAFSSMHAVNIFRACFNAHKNDFLARSLCSFGFITVEHDFAGCRPR